MFSSGNREEEEFENRGNDYLIHGLEKREDGFIICNKGTPRNVRISEIKYVVHDVANITNYLVKKFKVSPTIFDWADSDNYYSSLDRIETIREDLIYNLRIDNLFRVVLKNSYYELNVLVIPIKNREELKNFDEIYLNAIESPFMGNFKMDYSNLFAVYTVFSSPNINGIKKFMDNYSSELLQYIQLDNKHIYEIQDGCESRYSLIFEFNYSEDFNGLYFCDCIHTLFKSEI